MPISESGCLASDAGSAGNGGKWLVLCGWISVTLNDTDSLMDLMIAMHA